MEYRARRKLGILDSNQDYLIQSQACYRYTNPQLSAWPLFVAASERGCQERFKRRKDLLTRVSPSQLHPGVVGASCSVTMRLRAACG
jgi:hypothetical protein